MSEVTIISICEVDKEFCDRIALYVGSKSLYDVVVDDWRRPIIDGLITSVYYYGFIEPEKIKQILEVIGYDNLYEAIVKAMASIEIKDIRDEIMRLIQEANKVLERTEKLLK